MEKGNNIEPANDKYCIQFSIKQCWEIVVAEPIAEG
jgi:hypothetical protein